MSWAVGTNSQSPHLEPLEFDFLLSRLNHQHQHQ